MLLNYLTKNKVENFSYTTLIEYYNVALKEKMNHIIRIIEIEIQNRLREKEEIEEKISYKKYRKNKWLKI